LPGAIIQPSGKYRQSLKNQQLTIWTPANRTGLAHGLQYF